MKSSISLKNVIHKWQIYLEWLDKGPKKSANALASTEQFDQTHHTEQTEKVDIDDCLTRLENKEEKNYIRFQNN